GHVDDLIHVRAGLFDETAIVEHQVHQFYEPGARVIYTGEDGGIFDNSPNGNDQPTCSYQIKGHGYFEWAGDVAGEVFNRNTVLVVGAASMVSIECDSIVHEPDNLTAGSAIRHAGGTLHVRCRYLNGRGYPYWWTSGNSF